MAGRAAGLLLTPGLADQIYRTGTALRVESGIGTVARGVFRGMGTVALGGKLVDVSAPAPFRENSAVLLKYQINAPPPMTATRVKKTSKMLRQDFMALY